MKVIVCLSQTNLKEASIDFEFHKMLKKGGKATYTRISETLKLAWADAEGQHVVLNGQYEQGQETAAFDFPFFGLCAMVCAAPCFSTNVSY